MRSGEALEVAHLGGLLHDIGKLVMPIAFGEQELDRIAATAIGGPTRVDLERERLGCDHAQAGAMLALASQVDEPVVEAILAHHDPDGASTIEIACVQVANAVVGMLMGIDPDPVLVTRGLDVLGWSDRPRRDPVHAARRKRELSRLIAVRVRWLPGSPRSRSKPAAMS